MRRGSSVSQLMYVRSFLRDSRGGKRSSSLHCFTFLMDSFVALLGLICVVREAKEA